MATYEMRGGGIVVGDNARDVIEAIRTSSFNPESNTKAFIRALAERCEEYDGSIIRTESFDDVLTDLIKSGFLTLRK